MLETGDRENEYFFELVDDRKLRMTRFESWFPDFRENGCAYLATENRIHIFELVNSCKGLICYHGREAADEYDFFVVSNPVTGEYVTTPPFSAGEESDWTEKSISCAFGYSSMTNQYKILRVVKHYSESDTEEYENGEWIDRRSHKIYTLSQEEGTWKIVKCKSKGMGSTGSAEESMSSKCPCEKCVSLDFVDSAVIYFHSVAHWLRVDGHKMYTFDFDFEKFGEIQMPLQICSTKSKRTLGVLKGCLIVYNLRSTNQKLEIWVMKEYGLGASWTKDLIIELMPPIKNPCTPLQYTRNGELVLLQGEVLFLYNPVDKILRRFRIPVKRNSYRYEIAHTPSVFSLRDIFKHNDVKMINRSRVGKAFGLNVDD